VTRILVMVQTGEGRPKCVGEASADYRRFGMPLGSGEDRTRDWLVTMRALDAALRADRWWLVEAENAKHARALIGFKSIGLHGGHIALGSEVRGGRVIASGGKP